MRHPDRWNLSLVAFPAAMVQRRGDGRLFLWSSVRMTAEVL
jgi:hypothetical protein